MNARDQFRMIAKEVRAIAPVWVACAVAMFGWMAPRAVYQSYLGIVQGIAVMAHFVGAPAVGAMSFGHEYHYGTWSLLLTQPVGRRRLLLTKFGVLVVLIVPLGVLATWLDPLRGSNDFGVKVLWMPVFLGAFVAPWLTLVVRRPIGAAVFSVAIPGVLFIAGQVVSVHVYGYAQDADNVTTAFVSIGVTAACVAGAILGWRRFMHLELIEETAAGGREVRGVVASGRRAEVSRTSPIWRLLGKEMRLQQLTLAIAAVYAVAYLASALTWGTLRQFDTVTSVLTLLYGSLVSMIAGAVASAEERQLGTLDGQLLLPTAVRWQWTVKVAIVLTLAIALGYLLPRALAGSRAVQPTFAVLVLIMAAVSLYVSSVCRTTLTALILTLPVFAATALLLREIFGPISRAANGLMYGARGHYLRLGDSVGTTMIVIASLLLTTIVVWLALSNHRYADRSVVRIAAHAVLFVIALSAGLALLGVLGVR